MPLWKLKKTVRMLLDYGKTIGFLCMFSLVIAQPYLFAVSAPTGDSSDLVRAAYEDLLANTATQNDGSLQFETLIVGENGEATITYGVAAGDTLSSIAKNFGTSSEAIMEANGITDANLLRPGQKLVIAYDEGVIVDIKETMTVDQFTKRYDINKEEFLSMNYFEDENDMTMEEGRQVFVPLNQIEAEKKGLIEKEQFVKLDLPEPDPVLQQQLVVTDPIITGPTEPEIITADNAPVVQPENPNYEQIVITAEETQQHLKNLEIAKMEAQQAAEEAKRQAEIQAAKAEEAKRQAEIQKTKQSQDAAEAARKAAQAAQQAAEQQAQRAADAEQARKVAEAEAGRAAAQAQQTTQCGENQCAHKGRCWTPPANGICAPEDSNNAWVCQDGYTEYGNSCISETAAITRAPSSEPTVLAQWYFNPHKVDPSVYGRGPGHCTAMAAHLWMQNYGIRIRDHWRGNAKDWITNAKAAGFTVDTNPKPGSLMVSGYGYGGWGAYGHVMYVESVDLANGLVTVIDMNYKGRYIATKRTEAINVARGFIHPN